MENEKYNKRNKIIYKIKQLIYKHKFISIGIVLAFFVIVMFAYCFVDYNDFSAKYTKKMNFDYFELLFNTLLLLISGCFTYIFITSKADMKNEKAEEYVLKYTYKAAEEICDRWGHRKNSEYKIKKMLGEKSKKECIEELYHKPFSLFSGTMISIESQHIVEPYDFENYHMLETLWTELVDYEVERVASNRNSFSEEEQNDIDQILEKIKEMLPKVEHKETNKKIKNTEENGCMIHEEQNV